MEDDGDLRVRTETIGDYSTEVAISFIDTGCGIPQSELPKIFDYLEKQLAMLETNCSVQPNTRCLKLQKQPEPDELLPRRGPNMSARGRGLLRRGEAGLCPGSLSRARPSPVRAKQVYSIPKITLVVRDVVTFK